ncbi:acyl-CoA synthetase (AMP-forming)/AMP-acid ligase II [Streptosporangium becharense]|uniref:Acyl-CoA synthetase (AMP-forming)/AMP-acid ligase II n=1 Tax=Streptosporangium becharense TaxID=1816182 RepID=A0A7W9IC65_9ACTN|nr:class I adenylate-forming enzyme family protein [Streptosporangium becharense]MBB2914968.1 acyl-CoA synthetase (AMP-forming)/AMP-acid ligase II [Streptosporangium becharense]MBB5818017.1 acyl-CoA synthetase (AMP-forming)/AMP-acid ligase II [Streptosporangium becharense]
MTVGNDEVQARLTGPGQLFEMEEVTSRGTTVRTWKHAPRDFRALLEVSRLHGDKVFLTYDDEHLTYEEHFRRAATLAHRLVDDYGVAKGDRVAIAMRNYPEWVIAFSAALAAGAVAVPLNAWWTAQELEYGLSDSGAKVVIADGERAPALAGTGPALIVTRGETPGGARSFADVLGEVTADVTLPPVDLSPEDPATIFYTSGTTGRPKGALGSHRNLGQSPMTVSYSILRSVAREGRDPAATAGQRRVTLLTVPLFHVTGCFAVMTTTMFTGGGLVLMYKWDPGRALELIEREKITGISGVPTNVWQLLSHPDLDKYDISSLSALGYGGAPAPPKLLERITEQLAGRAPSNGYGMTETTALAIGNSGTDYYAKPDSVGLPMAVVDVRITDPSGRELPAGEVGELCLRGPNVILGYWNRPEATAETFVDGWLHTGDLARVDEEGFVFIVDRAKDMVIRGGENVYCAEVEAALFEHPAVEDAAVIGIPHDELGEEVGAVVRLSSPAGPEELQAFLRERIAAFKIPVRFWIREEELPRNPGGKILKTRLRREVLGA